MSAHQLPAAQTVDFCFINPINRVTTLPPIDDLPLIPLHFTRLSFPLEYTRQLLAVYDVSAIHELHVLGRSPGPGAALTAIASSDIPHTFFHTIQQSRIPTRSSLSVSAPPAPLSKSGQVRSVIWVSDLCRWLGLFDPVDNHGAAIGHKGKHQACG